MAEEIEDEAITADKLFTVFQNVTCVFAIILCIVMFIFGCVTVGTCPTQPGLPISIILQGLFTIGIPMLYLIKYRCGLKIKMTIFLTLFIVFLVFAFGNLIACTHFVQASGCKDNNVFKGGIAFVAILWVVTSVAAVTGLLKLCFVLRCRDEEEGQRSG